MIIILSRVGDLVCVCVSVSSVSLNFLFDLQLACRLGALLGHRRGRGKGRPISFGQLIQLVRLHGLSLLGGQLQRLVLLATGDLGVAFALSAQVESDEVPHHPRLQKADARH